MRTERASEMIKESRKFIEENRKLIENNRQFMKQNRMSFVQEYGKVENIMKVVKGLQEEVANIRQPDSRGYFSVGGKESGGFLPWKQMMPAKFNGKAEQWREW